MDRIDKFIGSHWAFSGPAMLNGAVMTSGTITAFSASVITAPGAALIPATAQTNTGNASWASYILEAVFSGATTGALTITSDVGYIDAWVEGRMTVDGVEKAFRFIPIRIWKTTT